MLLKDFTRALKNKKEYVDNACMYVISDINGEQIVGTFYEKDFQKTNEKDFRVEKVIKSEDNKLDLKWKDHISSFDSSIDKENIVQMSEYFAKPNSFGGKLKVVLSLSNYATKADLKNATGVDTSNFAKKTD